MCGSRDYERMSPEQRAAAQAKAALLALFGSEVAAPLAGAPLPVSRLRWTGAAGGLAAPMPRCCAGGSEGTSVPRDDSTLICTEAVRAASVFGFLAVDVNVHRSASICDSNFLLFDL